MAKRRQMNNILKVVRFEVVRNIKKPSFWVAAVLIPIGFAIYIAIAGLVGQNASQTIESGTDTTDKKLAYYDASGYLKIDTFKNAKGEDQKLEKYDDKEKGIADVKNHTIDVLYSIDKDFATTKKVTIYTKPEEATLVDNYSNPIRTLLAATAYEQVDELNVAVISNTIEYESTTFDAKDDHVVDMSEKVRQVIGPGLALACFYILMVVLGNRLTAAMVEEKENRISELILTSIKPSDLIIGKIISLMIAGLIQLLVIVIPVLILYKVGLDQNLIPNWFNLSFDLASIAQYLTLLIVSYFLFTAMCVAVGVISPTAKDANSFSSVVIIMVIMPIFFISSFMTSGTGAMTYVLSYFPPSAPIALMMRGLFNNLPNWEFWLGFAEIAIVGLLVAKLATNIFCRNAIEYTPKISIKNLLNNPRKNWKAKK